MVLLSLYRMVSRPDYTSNTEGGAAMTKEGRSERHEQFVYFCDVASSSLNKYMAEEGEKLNHGSHKDKLNWEDGYQKGYEEALRVAQNISRNILRAGLFD
jgi:hypothetical protein